MRTSKTSCLLDDALDPLHPETDTIYDNSEGNILDFTRISSPDWEGTTPGVRVSLILQNIAVTRFRNIVAARPHAFTELYGSKLDHWILGNSRNNYISGGVTLSLLTTRETIRCRATPGMT